LPEGSDSAQFTLAGGSGQALRGEADGEGRGLVLCHGLSATRRYVVHGSRYLPRHGFRLITYDARGHGESDPGPDGYGYPRLVEDLEHVIAHTAAEAGERLLLGGHSMGCHTATAWALANPDRVGALILGGPAWDGDAESEEALRRWDARAAALEQGGPDGFAEEMVRGSGGEVRDRIWHLARDRARLHRYPAAVARALREVPRSRPFGALEDLAGITAPVLVVGSRDHYDPAHPLATARAWAEVISDAEFAVEGEDEPPLTWQGGRLSREIARFLRERDLA